MNLRALSVLNLFALAATVVLNWLANSLPINGQTTAEISDSFEILITPAGYVFSIWGLIYLGLSAFVIYQLISAEHSGVVTRRVGPWFIISSLANMGWLLLWHYNQIPLSLVAMLVLLVSLIMIYLRLDIGRREVSRPVKWFVHVPFSIYLGWITVATIVNASVVLESLGWNGFGLSEPLWTVIMLAVATAVALVVARTRWDVAYLLVLVWAFVGIAVKYSDTALVLGGASVATVLVAGLALLAATTWKPLVTPGVREA